MKFSIDEEIKNGLNKNIYLLFGDENYLLNNYKKKIIKTLIPNESDIDTELTVFNNDKVSALNIIEACSIISFTGGRRIVLVNKSNFFSKGNATDIENMLEFINSDIDDYIVIFVENNVDKRSKLYKAVAKKGFSEEYNSLKIDDLAKFIVSQTKKAKSEISIDDAKYLALNVYNDLDNIVSEVNKLSSYKINDVITREDIDLICSKNLEVRVFELVDKIGQKDSKSAINIFNNMMLVKESPLMILTMIGRTFKTLLLCKTLLESGCSESEITSKTKLHPFVVKKNIAITRNFKKIELYNGLFEVLEADEKIKTGKMKDTICVSNIILKYANKEN